MDYRLDILISTDIWMPLSKGVFFVLMIIFIWIIDLFLHNYFSYFSAKVKIKKMKNAIEESQNIQAIESLINDKHSGDYRHYILDNILPTLLKNYLMKNRKNSFIPYIFSTGNYCDRIEKVLKLRGYKLLSMAIISLFAFFVFSINVYYNLLSKIEHFQIEETTDVIFVVLRDPFALFFFAVLNAFLAIWTYFSQRKISTWISLEIFAMDNLLSKRLQEEKVKVGTPKRTFRGQAS